MSRYIIEDWAGNICFKGKEFGSFEDGWEFLYEKFPNGDENRTFDDYFVISKTDHNYNKKYLHLTPNL